MAKRYVTVVRTPGRQPTTVEYAPDPKSKSQPSTKPTSNVTITYSSPMMVVERQEISKSPAPNPPPIASAPQGQKIVHVPVSEGYRINMQRKAERKAEIATYGRSGELSPEQYKELHGYSPGLAGRAKETIVNVQEQVMATPQQPGKQKLEVQQTRVPSIEEIEAASHGGVSYVDPKTGMPRLPTQSKFTTQLKTSKDVEQQFIREASKRGLPTPTTTLSQQFAPISAELGRRSAFKERNKEIEQLEKEQKVLEPITKKEYGTKEEIASIDAYNKKVEQLENKYNRVEKAEAKRDELLRLKFEELMQGEVATSPKRNVVEKIDILSQTLQQQGQREAGTFKGVTKGATGVLIDVPLGYGEVMKEAAYTPLKVVGKSYLTSEKTFNPYKDLVNFQKEITKNIKEESTNTSFNPVTGAKERPGKFLGFALALSPDVTEAAISKTFSSEVKGFKQSTNLLKEEGVVDIGATVITTSGEVKQASKVYQRLKPTVVVAETESGAKVVTQVVPGYYEQVDKFLGLKVRSTKTPALRRVVADVRSTTVDLNVDEILFLDKGRTQAYRQLPGSKIYISSSENAASSTFYGFAGSKSGAETETFIISEVSKAGTEARTRDIMAEIMGGKVADVKAYKGVTIPLSEQMPIGKVQRWRGSPYEQVSEQFFASTKEQVKLQEALNKKSGLKTYDYGGDFLPKSRAVGELPDYSMKELSGQRTLPKRVKPKEELILEAQFKSEPKFVDIPGVGTVPMDEALSMSYPRRLSITEKTDYIPREFIPVKTKKVTGTEQTLFRASDLPPSVELQLNKPLYGFSNVEDALGWQKKHGKKSIYQVQTSSYDMDAQQKAGLKFRRESGYGKRFSDNEFIFNNVLVENELGSSKRMEFMGKPKEKPDPKFKDWYGKTIKQMEVEIGLDGSLVTEKQLPAKYRTALAQSQKQGQFSISQELEEKYPITLGRGITIERKPKKSLKQMFLEDEMKQTNGLVLESIKETQTKQSKPEVQFSKEWTESRQKTKTPKEVSTRQQTAEQQFNYDFSQFAAHTKAEGIKSNRFQGAIPGIRAISPELVRQMQNDLLGVGQMKSPGQMQNIKPIQDITTGQMKKMDWMIEPDIMLDLKQVPEMVNPVPTSPKQQPNFYTSPTRFDPFFNEPRLPKLPPFVPFRYKSGGGEEDWGRVPRSGYGGQSYSVDLTGKALGITQEVSKKQLKALIEADFSGLEVRPFIRLKKSKQLKNKFGMATDVNLRGILA